MLSTPYYRTLTPINAIGYDEEADFNYGPYNIFCMGTRLYPIVYKLFGRDVQINFESIHENDRMNLKIRLVRITDSYSGVVPNQDLIISDKNKIILEREINKIISDDNAYCLIDKNELHILSRNKYPRSWFDSVLGYIELPDEYNPYIRENGIYLTFNPLSDYKTAYNEVVGLILDTLNQYYEDGVVYGASNIALKWKLERMDYDEVRPMLYRSTWKDKRFAPHLTEFLQSRINGDPYIRIKISDNMVNRHYIASALREEGITMIFDGSYIRIPIDNLDDAQYVASIVTSAQNNTTYRYRWNKVVTYSVNNISWIYLYIEAANKLFDLDNSSNDKSNKIVGYQTTDPEKPYTFSCLIDKHLSDTAILNKLNNIVYTNLSTDIRNKEQNKGNYDRAKGNNETNDKNSIHQM